MSPITPAPAAVVAQETTTPAAVDKPTNNTISAAVAESINHHDDPTKPPQDLSPPPPTQRGVQELEAVTLSWSKTSLTLTFINMWLLYLVNGFQSSILYNLIPFATSSFSAHSLLTVIYVVANCMTAAIYIPLAKILDVWGRAEGFLLMLSFATLGLILMACSDNLSTFCAAYVFYSVGFSGITYAIDVITAGASTLRNRGLAYAFTSSPYIITAFAGPKASEGFYENVSWQWGFGCFAIILPVVASPLFFILKRGLKKARLEGTVAAVEMQQRIEEEAEADAEAEEEDSRKGWGNKVWEWFMDFDAPGVILFATGLIVFLLPFTLAESAPKGWSSGYIIAMIVVGAFLLASFALYEAYVARVPFIRIELLLDRTVIGACALSATYQVSYYCWNSYFTSFLQVVNDLSLSEAGYVGNTFDVVSGVLLFIVGYGIRRTGRYRWLLFFAVPLYIMAQGLMIYFRRPSQYIGYVVMCQIFISVGGSIFIIVQQVAILAAADHQHAAAVLALLNVVANVGGAVGNTISGAIWTNTFYSALERYLPEAALPEIDKIYEHLNKQLSYPMGSPTRLAIQQAYGYSQTRMLAAGTGIMGLSLVWMFVMQNINVAQKAQVKGTVF